MGGIKQEKPTDPNADHVNETAGATHFSAFESAPALSQLGMDHAISATQGNGRRAVDDAAASKRCAAKTVTKPHKTIFVGKM